MLTRECGGGALGRLLAGRSEGPAAARVAAESERRMCSRGSCNEAGCSSRGFSNRVRLASPSTPSWNHITAWLRSMHLLRSAMAAQAEQAPREPLQAALPTSRAKESNHAPTPRWEAPSGALGGQARGPVGRAGPRLGRRGPSAGRRDGCPRPRTRPTATFHAWQGAWEVLFCRRALALGLTSPRRGWARAGPGGAMGPRGRSTRGVPAASALRPTQGGPSLWRAEAATCARSQTTGTDGSRRLLTECGGPSR